MQQRVKNIRTGRTPADEALAVGEVTPHPWGEDCGEILGLEPWGQCGCEMVSMVYLRVGQEPLCIPCSGYER